MRTLISIMIMLGLGAPPLTYAQVGGEALFTIPDTAKVFSLNEFYGLILKNHPVAKQANLLSAMGQQEIRLARGNFDPKLQASFDLKSRNDKEYYRLFDGNIKLPTASPLTPVVGLERNTGEYLDPEHYISAADNYQQMYAGVSMQVGAGLFTDERRTALKQAQLFAGMLEAEQVKMINKLLLEAAKDYWQWFFNYYQYRVAENNFKIADDVFTRVLLNVNGGEAAPIDSVQAKVTLLERKVSRQEAITNFRNSTLKLSVYLWDSLGNAAELLPNYIPYQQQAVAILSQGELDELVNFAKEKHPELRKLNIKLQQYEVDRRLAAEFLKPRLDLSYYRLSPPVTNERFNDSFEINDNYKLSLDFSIPLFLRKERAKLAQTKIKINTTNFDLQLTRRTILNEINMAHNQLINNGIVMVQQRAMVESYERLVKAELLNLENGESDLFKINLQQEKLFNAQTKLIKTISEYEKQRALLYWSAGVTPLVN